MHVRPAYTVPPIKTPGPQAAPPPPVGEAEDGAIEAAFAPLIARGQVALADVVGEIKETVKTIEQVREDDDERAETREEEQAAAARAVAAIRRSQYYLSANASKAALAALVESGLSLDKISFDLFSRVMHHAEKRPRADISPEERALTRGRPDGPLLLAALGGHGLPVHEKNIEAIDNTWARTPRTLDGAAAERLIADESDVTIENAYKAAHSVRRAPEAPAAWQAPRDMLLKVFGREGIEATEENLEAARFLVARGLDVNAETVEKAAFLATYKASRERLYDRAAARLAEDEPLGGIALRDIAEVSQARDAAAAALKSVQAAAARHEGLRIDDAPLRETLRHLTRQDEANLARYLRMADAPETPEAVGRMKEVTDALALLRPLTANVHPFILRDPAAFTLETVSGQAQFARAQAGYEQFATVPDARYGDSFARVRTQFAPLLAGMGIAATAANMKAAFILSKNDLTVNDANLLAVKEIDAKIEAIANRLHPLVAAHMIKDGLRPLEMHADQVLAYIKRFDLDMGEDGGAKIARYIMEMDESGAVDGDTRKAMIAVYRMLHVIQKDGAAALGLALRQNPETPLTLGGLMELSKYYQSQRKAGAVFDYSVDDAFGHLERVTRPAESIRAALEGVAPRAAYADLVAQGVIDRAAPKTLSDWLARDADAPLEELLYREAAAANGETAARQAQAFIAAQPGLIHYLHGKNIAPTLPLLRAAEKLGKSKRALTEALDDAGLEVDALANAEGLDGLSDADARADGTSPAAMMAQAWAALGEPTPQVEAARALLALQNGLNGESGFTVPVNLNGKTSSLNLYVVNEKALHEDGARVFLSLDAGGLGEVRGYFTLDGGTLDLSLEAATPEALRMLQDSRGILIDELRAAGIAVGALGFTVAGNAAEAEAEAAREAPPPPAEAASTHEYRV